jgi:transcriptional regulatory protein LevR
MHTGCLRRCKSLARLPHTLACYSFHHHLSLIVHCACAIQGIKTAHQSFHGIDPDNFVKFVSQ